jgi:hypothetical protein
MAVVQFEFSVDETGILLVVGKGQANLRDHLHLIDAAAKRGKSERLPFLLLDLRELTPILDDDDHIALGAYGSCALDGFEKSASLVLPHNRNGKSERPARKIGLPFRVFTDLAQAREWLLEPSVSVETEHVPD